MCSIRKLLIACLGVSTTAMTGCTGRPPTWLERTDKVHDQAVNKTPIVYDDAMKHRNWEPVDAQYLNGTVVAYPTLNKYRAASNLPEPTYLLIDPPLFLVQTALMPLAALAAPAWEAKGYPTMVIPPTYTAQPPLPPR